jgi:hypothetical protein
MATKLIQAIREPAQFSLRSIFVATSAVGVALGVLNWLGPFCMILAVQFQAVIAVLMMTRGTAGRGVVIGGTIASFLLIPVPHDELLAAVAFWASLSAWLGGALVADAESMRRSLFLRWTWLLASVWFLAVVVALAVLRR